MCTLTGAEEAGGGEMVAPRLSNGYRNQTWGPQGGGRSAVGKYSSLVKDILESYRVLLSSLMCHKSLSWEERKLASLILQTGPGVGLITSSYEGNL